MSISKLNKLGINIKSVIEGYSRDVQQRISKLPQHEQEQFIERATACEPCLKRGGCVICGCKTPQLFYANKGCPAMRYPGLRSKEQWNQYKFYSNIDYLTGETGNPEWWDRALKLFKTVLPYDLDEALEAIVNDQNLYLDLKLFTARWFKQQMKPRTAKNPNLEIVVTHKELEDIMFKFNFDNQLKMNSDEVQRTIYKYIAKAILTYDQFLFHVTGGKVLSLTKDEPRESVKSGKSRDNNETPEASKGGHEQR